MIIYLTYYLNVQNVEVWEFTLFLKMEKVKRAPIPQKEKRKKIRVLVMEISQEIQVNQETQIKEIRAGGSHVIVMVNLVVDRVINVAEALIFLGLAEPLMSTWIPKNLRRNFPREFMMPWKQLAKWQGTSQLH